jgi:hypothetical protein
MGGTGWLAAQDITVVRPRAFILQKKNSARGHDRELPHAAALHRKKLEHVLSVKRHHWS